ncbi:hypothetical protein JGH11_02870 [Dysgonomonas sp. Marseille-P4677]|uniref:hypothetical protein n=1 Tax=Dysgonomonas sp. Marseille-P4677 TaxID=2364790 RepID=UPI0019130650|nr:hypothetical protein [Dysgonomonas sp. Marseille-P4677]MBK5719810.1 hypothetical protein [Dysgonomonas sp. Marseille-P4677]
MTDKIKELRKLLPIPIGEALQMLKTNDGDVERCVFLFKAKSIKEISELTGCDEKTVAYYYEAEKYDFNRTVSTIREDTYDKNYKQIEGVTKEAVFNVLQWLRIIESEDFGVSLDYQLLDRTLQTLVLIPSLSEIALVVEKAKSAKDLIFEGYQDTDSLDEFVRRHRKLDDSQDFQIASELVGLKLTIMKEELLRHSRNL